MPSQKDEASAEAHTSRMPGFDGVGWQIPCGWVEVEMPWRIAK
jgi:hypothetical protein